MSQKLNMTSADLNAMNSSKKPAAGTPARKPKKEQTIKPARSKDLQSIILRTLVRLAALVVMAMLIYMILNLVIEGLPGLKPDLFAWTYNSENVSMLPALINTIFMAALTLLFSVPCAIGAAIYLTEFARPGSLAVRIITLAAETLSGVPSIIFGLFGAMFFVRLLDLKMSILSGSLTLAIMVLPLLIRTTQQALEEVDGSFREASLGLGASKVRTIFKIVLPCAKAGIINGIILAMGRIVGESAALIFTAGTVSEMATSVFSSGRTLAVHMYALASEGLYIRQTYSTALVLLVLTLGLNALTEWIAGRMNRGTADE